MQECYTLSYRTGCHVPNRGTTTRDIDDNYAPPIEDFIKCSSEWDEKKAKRAEWQANKRRYRSKINY